MKVQLTLAARYLAGRKLRSVLTTLAIVFGVAVLFAMNSGMPALERAFQANALAAAGQVDATITLKSADAFPAETAVRVASVDGVRAVLGLLDRTVNLPADYYDGDPARVDGVSALSLVGLDVEAARAIHIYSVKAGRFLEAGDRDAAVISESLADAIGVRLGDSLRLPTARGESALTVVGILPARATPGNEEVLVTLPQAQTMLAMPGQINTAEAVFDTIDAGERAEIEGQIIADLGEAYQLGTLGSGSDLLTSLQVGRMIFSLLAVLALLMGAFIIFNTFRTIVAERRRDIGMLRALGASRATIFGLIATEGLIQGLAGTVLGVVLGYLLAIGMLTALSPMLRRFLNVSLGGPSVTLGLVAGSLAVGLGVTLLAGLLPAVAAARVTPLEALRPPIGAVTLRRMAGPSFWIGAVALALAVGALVTRDANLIGLGGALFVLGLILCAPALVNPIANLFGALLAAVFARGGTAQLAEGNLSRQPSRAAITASTTLIGLALLVMAASLISSVQIGFGRLLRKSLGSDYLLVPPSIAVWGTNVGAGPELGEALRAVDGVEAVSGLRFAPTRIGELAVTVLGIDPATYPQVSGLTFVEGDEPSAYAAVGADRSVIANALLAATAGLKPGDEVALLTPAGPQTYRVVAIANDYLNAKLATAYISSANIAADFNRTEDVLLQVNLAPGADQTAAAAGLKAVVADYPQFRLIAGQEYIEENLRIFDAAFAGMFALVIVLAIPSLIAMVNTLAIGVIERTREIGMLRAVGATRGQVRTVILAEALILAAIGTALGVLSGLYLGYMGVEALRAAGFPMEYVFPADGLLLAIAAGLLFGALAAVIPARQAARLQIIQALRYE
jgi:putative ABC transport system permease protein